MLIRTALVVTIFMLAACGASSTGSSDSFNTSEADGSETLSPDDASSESEVFGQPQMAVLIDNQEVGDGDISHFEIPVFASTKTVAITNAGDGPLRIVDVRWDVDGAGSPRKNMYVALDLRGAGRPFPLDLVPGDLDSIAVSVTFTPPAGRPLDDGSDSILVIESSDPNAPLMRVTFELAIDGPAKVSPASYTFRNATRMRPERNEFRIYNNSLTGESFAILGVTLESPSSEFLLSNLPVPGYVSRPPGNPGYQDVIFVLTYQPSDDEVDSNAIIIETDVGRVHVPISTIMDGR